MAAIYARWVMAERMTVEDVPERWRAEVQSLIAPLEAPAE